MQVPLGGRVTCLEGARVDCQETTGRRCPAVSRGDSKSRPIEARVYASSLFPFGGVLGDTYFSPNHYFSLRSYESGYTASHSEQRS